jgi:hypothetical protein
MKPTKAAVDDRADANEESRRRSLSKLKLEFNDWRLKGVREEVFVASVRKELLEINLLPNPDDSSSLANSCSVNSMVIYQKAIAEDEQLLP